MRQASIASVMLAVLCIACGASLAGEAVEARAFPEAEKLFHQNSRWLGGDAALSIPLSPTRTLWLFGDSFVATSPALKRTESKLVRNSVAVQTGRDPRAAAMTFAWRSGESATPASFFPESGDRWYWPGHGIRLREGPLVVFLYQLASSPEGLGFKSTGYALALIENPDDPPKSWAPRIVDAPPLPFDALPATAVVREGDHVIALAIRQEGTHAGALVRHRASVLARGDLSSAEWWVGAERGWTPAERLGPSGPAFVIDDAGAECSLHWDDRVRAYVHVASYGFGASVVGVRTAPALTGPWSAPRMVYRPPESDGPRPFVYAAKAHPELRGQSRDDLVITYATNSFDFSELVGEQGQRTLYWPRVVALPLAK